MIYFIQDKNLVKIGYTSANQTKQRLASLQVGNPSKLKVIKTIYGGPLLEADLHRLFSGQRVRGEWYRLEGSLKHFITHAIGIKQLWSQIYPYMYQKLSQHVSNVSN